MATSNKSTQIFDLTSDNDSDESYVFLSSLSEEENVSESDDETVATLIQKQKRKLDTECKDANNKNKMRKTDSPVKQHVMKRKHSGSDNETDGNTADSESDNEENNNTNNPPTVRGFNFTTGDWHCLQCGDSMGCHNPRQYCGKWCCLNAKTA